MKSIHILALLIAGAPGSALAQTGSLFDGRGHVLGFDENGVSNGTVERSVCGDIDNDGRLDFAGLKDGEVIGALAPGVHSAVFATHTYVNDLAMRRGASSQSGDRAYTASNQGLFSWSFDSVNVEWEKDTPALLTQGVDSIEVGDLDGDGVQDLALLMDDGVTIVSVVFDDDYDNANAQNTLFQLPTAITEFALLDWTGNGRDELAFIQGGSLEIRTQAGVLLDSVLALPGTIELTTLRYGDGDALAWCIPDFMGAYQWLFVAKSVSGSLDLEGPIDLGSLSVSAMSSGDWGDDGVPDLFLTPRTGDYLVMMNNADRWGASQASFSYGSTKNVSFDLDTIGNGDERLAPAVLGDFDDDSDIDLVIANEATQGLHVCKGTTIDETDLFPYREFVEICGGDDDLWFDVGFPASLSQPSGFAQANVVEVSVYWTNPTTQTLEPYTPVGTLQFPIGPVSFEVPDLSATGTSFTIELRYKLGNQAFPSILATVSRDAAVVADLSAIYVASTGESGFAPNPMVWCYIGPGGGGGSGQAVTPPASSPSVLGPAPVAGSGDVPEERSRPFTEPD